MDIIKDILFNCATYFGIFCIVFGLTNLTVAGAIAVLALWRKDKHTVSILLFSHVLAAVIYFTLIVYEIL